AHCVCRPGRLSGGAKGAGSVLSRGGLASMRRASPRVLCRVLQSVDRRWEGTHRAINVAQIMHATGPGAAEFALASARAAKLYSRPTTRQVWSLVPSSEAIKKARHGPAGEASLLRRRL